MYSASIKTDFTNITGKIKPMHSVNNGPVGSRAHSSGTSNDIYYTEAAIPYARNHDANFFSCHGGPHVVDIIAIFPNFDADENDPCSYDFHLTDEYIEKTHQAGTKTFYRLGNRIEHETKKYGSVPPKDFHKFARICEHIIAHMNYGWANGTNAGIEYWEIWNEPDLGPECWTGTKEQFFELYDITARHLKKCFPSLKIGGPAVTHVGNEGFLVPMFEYMTKDKNDPVPMDFFSFHIYTKTPEYVAEQGVIARDILDKYGYTETETILNEWNYVRNWSPVAEMLYNKKVIPSLKGSAFLLSTMLACQKSPLDHLMYYDASMPSIWNGLFDKDSYLPKKPYYALYAFSRLYLLSNEVKCVCDAENVYTSAAVSKDGNEAVIVIAHYEDLESTDGKDCKDKTKTLRIDWTGFSSENGVLVTYKFLDGEHNVEPVSEEVFFGSKGAHILELALYTSVVVTLKKL